MPYIQSICVFLIVVLNLTGYLEIGDLSPKSPNLYLSVIQLISFFVGLWALFMFFDITHRYKLLQDFRYRQKSALLKLIVVLVNIQVRNSNIDLTFQPIYQNFTGIYHRCFGPL